MVSPPASYLPQATGEMLKNTTPTVSFHQLEATGASQQTPASQHPISGPSLPGAASLVILLSFPTSASRDPALPDCSSAPGIREAFPHFSAFKHSGLSS